MRRAGVGSDLLCDDHVRTLYSLQMFVFRLRPVVEGESPSFGGRILLTAGAPRLFHSRL